MTSVETLLAEVFEDVPVELVTYFDLIADGSYSGMEEIELNLLPIEDAIDLTWQFHDFHPIVQAFDGFVLDDPNTSNHHVYLASGPLKGAVLFLCHDGDTRVVFASLSEFVDAAAAAERDDYMLSEAHPTLSPLASDQAALSRLIREELEADDGTTIITSVIPSMDLRDLALLRLLVEDDDFFLGEAVGIAISRRPAVELQEIVDLCLRHRHRQVVNAGRRAVAAVERLR